LAVNILVFVLGVVPEHHSNAGGSAPFYTEFVSNTSIVVASEFAFSYVF
jgi:hypothetical protein